MRMLLRSCVALAVCLIAFTAPTPAVSSAAALGNCGPICWPDDCSVGSIGEVCGLFCGVSQGMCGSSSSCSIEESWYMCTDIVE